MDKFRDYEMAEMAAKPAAMRKRVK